MPWSPKTPCSHPGCGALSHGRFCAEHEAEHRAVEDARRGSAGRRGYGAAWRKVRKQVLNDEPLCRECLAHDRVTAATDVDHIDGNPRNNARENLRPLCHSCHSKRTARDQGYGRKRKGGAG
jgi:5-methylcytosine-specific restriction protein A